MDLRPITDPELCAYEIVYANAYYTYTTHRVTAQFHDALKTFTTFLSRFPGRKVLV